MNIVTKIKNTITNARQSVRRFPLAMSFSFLLCVLLIAVTNMENRTSDMYSTLSRLAFVSAMGIAVFLLLHLQKENLAMRKPEQKIHPALFFGSGFAVLVGFYVYLAPTADKSILVYERTSVYFGMLLFWILSSMYQAKIKRQEAYVPYVIEIFESFCKSLVYGVVVYIGLSAIFFTIDKLFDLEIGWKWYTYSAYITFIPFCAGIFLADFPSTEYADLSYNMGRAFRVLLVNIVTPLLIIYTGILYVYCAKVLILREWPQGIVGNLTLWYGIISVAILFLLSAVQKENEFARKIKTYFPIFILPMLIIMFVAMFMRINQYGLTANRYYVLLAGIWVLLSMLYYQKFPEEENFWIPVILSVVVFMGSVGPLSGYHIEAMSQNRRLEKMLIDNNMLQDGKIIPNENISEEDKLQISEIIRFMENNHKTKEIKVLRNYQEKSFEEVFGFSKQEYRYDYLEEEQRLVEHFDIYSNGGDVLDISEFDRVYKFELELSYYGEAGTEELKNNATYLYANKQMLTIFFYDEEGKQIAKDSVLWNDIVEELKKYDNGKEESRIGETTSKSDENNGPIIYRKEIEDVSYCIHFNNFHSSKDTEGNKYTAISIEGNFYYTLHKK